jgi:predicted DCC family thiol-disulfide oxidoreductase YuxK
MVDLKVVLNEMDDLIFQGKCRYCNGKMKRYIELGENKEYHMRTQLIKESKQNKN